MSHSILIVDDRRDDVLLTEMVLNELTESVRMESASSGEQALEILKNADELPSAVLLDLKMPGMGGIETLKRIRADERLKSLPVLVVTCSTLETDVQASLEAGATAFIHKAIRFQEFSKSLEPYIKAIIG